MQNDNAKCTLSALHSAPFLVPLELAPLNYSVLRSSIRDPNDTTA